MAQNTQQKYIFVPSIKEGWGTGHLVRCLRWAKETGSSIFITQEKADYPLDLIKKNFKEWTVHIHFITSLQDVCADLIILDHYKTTKKLYEQLERIAPVLCLDEGGGIRKRVPYLLDLLPGVSPVLPNLYHPGLLFNAVPQRNFSHSFPQKILICFGGEDNPGLGVRLLSFFIKNKLFELDTVSLVCRNRPPLVEEYPAVKWESFIPELKEKLSSWDLVCTQFGLTAFEAFMANVPVLLLNPSTYHQKLASKAGFFSLGVHQPQKRRMHRALSLYPNLPRPESFSREDFLHFLSDFTPLQISCPVCSSTKAVVLARFKERTFFKCKTCGMIYQKRAFPLKQNLYSADYFFKDYSKQYGKTYLEDFEHIKKFSQKRVALIKKILAKKWSENHPLKTYEKRLKVIESPSLLDVGCAFGPFLSAAAEEGFSVCGTDVSEDALKWVAESLHFSVIRGQFPQIEASRQFNVISMWYVIEHFNDLDPVLKKVSSLLERRGVFAFSTPNARGISSRRRPLGFLEESPQDHFTIWDKASAAKVLRRYGFKIVFFRTTGIHLKRFPSFCSYFPRLSHKIAECFALGDTFEVYAIKEK